MTLRICGGCKKKKAPGKFNWKKRNVKLLHSICKECHSDYRKRHYNLNRDLYITKARKWNGNQRLKLRNVVLEYLKDKSCIDCDEEDITVLDFDHREGKIKAISQMVQDSCSVDSLIKEIKKCEVRCANCHRRKTAREFKYWKIKMGT